jgi:hypothetical protein
MATIGLRADVKKLFFDRAAVMKQINAQKRRYYAKSGATAMRTARRLIRKVVKAKTVQREGLTPVAYAAALKKERYRRASRPGQPPRSRTGLLQKNIFFAFDGPRGGVIIGPVKLGGKGLVPKVLEAGGFSQRRTRAGVMKRDRIAPRPYMAPALRKTKAELPQLLAESFRRS